MRYFPFREVIIQALLIIVSFACYTSTHAQELKLDVQPIQFTAITMHVTDYNQWQKTFAEDIGKPNKSGFIPIAFARDVDTPDIVMVGCIILDLAKAKSYAGSADMRADMSKYHLLRAPQVRPFYCLDEIDDESGNSRFLVLTNRVSDYDLWRRKFFASEKERLTSGVNYVAVVHTIDDPAEISIICTYTDLRRAHDFVLSGYLQGAMATAGVLGTPGVRYLVVGGEIPPPAPAESLSKDKLSIYISANVKCTVAIDGRDQGEIAIGAIKRIALPVGDHFFLFKTVSSPGDTLNIKYKVDKTGGASTLYADMQAAIHRRIIKEQSPASTRTIEQQNADPYNMVLVKGGTFSMGSDSLTSEVRQHTVSLRDFYISQYEVTQKQWKEIMGTEPSHFHCDYCPVENVSQQDAIAFIQKLNATTGRKYRLPTEAEWEYSARGGSESKHFIYSGSNNPDEVAWHNANSSRETHPVGQKKPNELGLYDMTGNVFEWCSDWFSYTYYTDGSKDNPGGPERGQWAVLRGGSWNHGETELQPVYRAKDEPTNRGRHTGFRLVREK